MRRQVRGITLLVGLICLTGAAESFAGPITLRANNGNGNAGGNGNGNGNAGGNGNGNGNGNAAAPVPVSSSTCSSPTCVDLTTRGATGTANGALFQQIDPQPTGTGYIDPFVRLQSGGVQPVTQGYNTSYRPFEFNEKNPLNYTHDLLLSDVGQVLINGIVYREFLLDINESRGHDDELLSLDKLQIFQSPTGNRTGYSDLGTLIWDLDAGADRYVKLDYALNHGSGSGDMAVFIPDNLFLDLDYVYLFSRFGDQYPVSAGFEEWWSRRSEVNIVPEPSSLLLLGGGLAAMVRRRRAHR